MHGKIWIAALVAGSWACAQHDEGSQQAERAVEAPIEDADVEAIVRAELEHLERNGATRAAIVVLAPDDGRVLAALGSGPEGDAEAERDAPNGSTTKPFTIAAALEAGLDPARRFEGGERWRDAEGRELVDAHPRESLDARDVITHSSNVGAGRIVEAVGGEAIREMLDLVGIAGESESWTARGSGVDAHITPLRLAGAYAAFANGGYAIEPTADGSGTRRRVMREATANTMLGMLESAVSDEGTGSRARVEGVRVAGKTGTTRTGAAVFAGIAPVDAPRWVVVVRVEAPDAYGGSVAAPAFARIVQALR